MRIEDGQLKRNNRVLMCLAAIARSLKPAMSGDQRRIEVFDTS